MARTFYRVVKRNPPTRDNFLSCEALGIRLLRDTPEARRQARGVSVYSRMREAREKSEVSPHLGKYIATLEIPDGSAITFAQTSQNRRHFTHWGESDDLLACVTRCDPA